MIVAPLALIVGFIVFYGRPDAPKPTTASRVPAEVRGAPLAAPLREESGQDLSAGEFSPSVGSSPMGPGGDFRRRDASTLDPRTASLDAPPVESGGGYQSVTFKQLAGFSYTRFPHLDGMGGPFDPNTPGKKAEPAAPETVETSVEPATPDADSPPENKIPPEIRALDGEMVAVSGFMLPIEVRQGKVTNFMLVRNMLGCCFGVPLELNEWIDVTMAEGQGTRYISDVPIAVRGKLEVGEKSIDGWVLSIYRLQADDVRPLSGF